MNRASAPTSPANRSRPAALTALITAAFTTAPSMLFNGTPTALNLTRLPPPPASRGAAALPGPLLPLGFAPSRDSKRSWRSMRDRSSSATMSWYKLGTPLLTARSVMDDCCLRFTLPSSSRRLSPLFVCTVVLSSTSDSLSSGPSAASPPL